jgi:ATP-dependent DNA ligase
MHWVEPRLVAEILSVLATDGLWRHTVYVGLRQDKPAMDVRREAVALVVARRVGVAEPSYEVACWRFFRKGRESIR